MNTCPVKRETKNHRKATAAREMGRNSRANRLRAHLRLCHRREERLPATCPACYRRTAQDLPAHDLMSFRMSRNTQQQRSPPCQGSVLLVP